MTTTQTPGQAFTAAAATITAQFMTRQPELTLDQAAEAAARFLLANMAAERPELFAQVTTEILTAKAGA